MCLLSSESRSRSRLNKVLTNFATVINDDAFTPNTNDDIADLGIRMGKLRYAGYTQPISACLPQRRLTERIGGFFRPRMTEEVFSGPRKSILHGLTCNSSRSYWLILQWTTELLKKKLLRFQRHPEVSKISLSQVRLTSPRVQASSLEM